MKHTWTVTLAVLAACVGWTGAIPFDGVSRPYLAMVCAGSVLVGVGFRIVDAGRFGWVAAGETAAVLAVPLLLFAFGSIVAPLDESSLLAGLVASLAVWLVGAITITDIEAVTEPTDLVEGVSGALGRIATRLLVVGVGLMIAVLAGHGGFSPVNNARPIQAGLVVPFILYWVVGLSGVSGLNRSRLMARWERDRSLVAEDLTRRWQSASGLWLAAATFGAAVWWWVGRPLLVLAHGAFTTGWRAASAFFGRLLGGQVPTGNPAAPSQTTAVTAAPNTTVNQFTPPPAWFDLFLLLAAGAIFAFAFVVFHRRAKARAVSGTSVLWSVVRAVSAALWQFLKGLMAILLALFRWRRADSSAGERGRPSARKSSSGWSPADPIRRRIAGEYRTFLTAAGERLGPIPGAETPAELAVRIEVVEASNPAVGVLTRIYEKARFSIQPLDETVVRQAQEARTAIIGGWEEPG